MDVQTTRTILLTYERFADEWQHPTRKTHLADHPRGAPLLVSWHEVLRSIADRFEPIDELESIISVLDPGSDAYRGARRAVGAYLWEIVRREYRDIIVPEALRTLKPDQRRYLEPILVIIDQSRSRTPYTSV